MALEKNKYNSFIGVIPAISDVEEYLALINEVEKSKIKGVMISGDNDVFYPQVEDLYKGLKESDFPIKLITEKGLGHSISKRFPKQIKSAIKYIME